MNRLHARSLKARVAAQMNLNPNPLSGKINKEAAVNLFLSYLKGIYNIDKKEFEDEFGITPEKYLFQEK